MDFSLDQTQETVAEIVVGLLAREHTDPADTGGFSPELWQALAKADLLSLAVPERLGGDGLGMLEVATMLTEIGRGAAPVPALATLGFGVLPVLALGSAQQQDALLDGIAGGRVLTAALAEEGAAFPSVPSTTAVADGDGVVVTGHKIAVPFADIAHRILVPTDAGVVLVAPDAPGVTLTPSATSSGGPEFSLRLDAVRVPAGDVLGDGIDGVATLNRIALASIGAYADGLLAGATALAADHLTTREQFGKPLAAFQAVAQQIADVYVTSRTLHVSALASAWRVAEGLDAADDLDVLAYWIASEIPAAMRTLHHLHGGIGVDVTYPMHRYFSIAKDLARLVGGASYRLDLVGARCSSI
ncbi:acyl-CoA dehydrogenase family protein [Prescottella equi]|uniref:acyl-CoA dehydrogenase family protein n=1 Tax=Rhodococcus hoagii TaxID=43767 RepID=UPI000A10780B|nr:acyl-CoA dehydrogenase family protein [Prescottella equi]MBU4617221.1 acyl-CoA/acyl-ACP dehydrogenase [Rhodococcus sp. GG48]ORL09055.1 acyl-CoA dehydrogenase [Prescottella equi]